MKNTIKLLAMSVAFAFCFTGCGGGSSSSSPSSSTGLPNSVVFNPLRDLALGAGDQVCFSIKSYNNISESTFSKAVCGLINNNDSLTLSWNEVSGDVVGYYVYFGSNRDDATNFLTDVFES
jgi:hypothetical protein